MKEVDEREKRLLGGKQPGRRVGAKAVKQKDGHRCQVCGEAPSGKLVSHHLDNYKDHPELRAVVENGVCLCVDHHLEFHKTFGFKGNTKEQFLKFKEMKQ